MFTASANNPEMRKRLLWAGTPSRIRSEPSPELKDLFDEVHPIITAKLFSGYDDLSPWPTESTISDLMGQTWKECQDILYKEGERRREIDNEPPPTEARLVREI